MIQLDRRMLQVKDSARICGPALLTKTSLTQFFPQTHNKIHPCCLAFTYRAL